MSDTWTCGACGEETSVTHFRTGPDGRMIHAPEAPLTDISPGPENGSNDA